jgi:hypothetical protein
MLASSLSIEHRAMAHRLSPRVKRPKTRPVCRWLDPGSAESDPPYRWLGSQPARKTQPREGRGTHPNRQGPAPIWCLIEGGMQDGSGLSTLVGRGRLSTDGESSRDSLSHLCSSSSSVPPAHRRRSQAQCDGSSVRTPYPASVVGDVACPPVVRQPPPEGDRGRPGQVRFRRPRRTFACTQVVPHSCASARVAAWCYRMGFSWSVVRTTCQASASIRSRVRDMTSPNVCCRGT